MTAPPRRREGDGAARTGAAAQRRGLTEERRAESSMRTPRAERRETLSEPKAGRPVQSAVAIASMIALSVAEGRMTAAVFSGSGR